MVVKQKSAFLLQTNQLNSTQTQRLPGRRRRSSSSFLYIVRAIGGDGRHQNSKATVDRELGGKKKRKERGKKKVSLPKTTGPKRFRFHLWSAHYLAKFCLSFTHPAPTHFPRASERSRRRRRRRFMLMQLILPPPPRQKELLNEFVSTFAISSSSNNNLNRRRRRLHGAGGINGSAFKTLAIS